MGDKPEQGAGTGTGTGPGQDQRNGRQGAAPGADARPGIGAPPAPQSQTPRTDPSTDAAAAREQDAMPPAAAAPDPAAAGAGREPATRSATEEKGAAPAAGGGDAAAGDRAGRGDAAAQAGAAPEPAARSAAGEDGAARAGDAGDRVAAGPEPAAGAPRGAARASRPRSSAEGVDMGGGADMDGGAPTAAEQALDADVAALSEAAHQAAGIAHDAAGIAADIAHDAAETAQEVAADPARLSPARLFSSAAGAFRTLRRAVPRMARARWAATRETLRREGPSALQFWIMALVLGIACGYAAVGFRLAIAEIQTFIYGADDHRLHSTLKGLDWMIVLSVPILGGLAVGVILHWFTRDGRAESVSHVIEAAALKGGRLSRGSGRASAFASLITLSTGGSTGREGPVVHLAALISSWVSSRIDASPVSGRDLLGCAVAAAVSASFNAPIAGALFAMEVVLRHFALHAFAPIVIASIAGAVVSRLHLGDVTEFRLPEHTLEFYHELPAFLLLGFVCGLAAVAMMRSIFVAEALGDRAQRAVALPRWLRPAVSGAMLGMLAIWFPHIIGVGYETTSRALTGELPLGEAVVFAMIKVVAVALTFAGRMGGGVFSPSLMLGALTGLAFGHVAVNIFPAVSGSEALYALAGTGATAAAVLGAPVSTTMIIFELTGDWQAGIAVMASVSTAVVLAARLVDKSFFLTQLEMRDVHLAEGAHAWVPGAISVRDVMRVRGADNGAPDGACWQLAEQNAALTRLDTLEKALPMFDRMKANFLPVVEEGPDGRRDLIGAVFHVDALKAYNRKLVALHREEHS